MNLQTTIRKAVAGAPVTDFHTHLFTPSHGGLCLWGIDHLLTYHYLVAELFRYQPALAYDKFWATPREAQADLIWKTLFVDHTPVSEAARGVITTLSKLGADPNVKNLAPLRKFYKKFTLQKFIDKVFDVAKIEQVYMTNDPFIADERHVWLSGHKEDRRFRKALRMDGIYRDWKTAREALKTEGLETDEPFGPKTLESGRRFFEIWCDRIKPEYLAISLPPEFAYPSADDLLAKILIEVMIPIAAERGLPAALMIGVNRNVNPALRGAGDSVGLADVRAVESLCRDFPEVRFFCTLLARENQHALCVAARKFKNLTPFGCWWFLNNPSIIEEITRERIELLGLTSILQHSDCRILDQLVYKWDHSKTVIGKVLLEQYQGLARSGRRITAPELSRDINAVFSGSVKKLLHARAH